MIVRLYQRHARTRDYLFLALLAFSAMLASAILTVDTMFLFFFLVFLALAISTFIGLEMRRSAEGAISPPIEPGTACRARGCTRRWASLRAPSPSARWSSARGSSS